MKKGDAVLVGVFLILGAIWLAVYHGASVGAGERLAVIQKDGAVYRTVVLDDPARSSGKAEELIDIRLDNGKHMVVAVGSRGVYVKKAVCPDRLCQRMGTISKPGQTIVCLPNKVVISIKDSAAVQVDEVSY